MLSAYIYVHQEKKHNTKSLQAVNYFSTEQNFLIYRRFNERMNFCFVVWCFYKKVVLEKY